MAKNTKIQHLRTSTSGLLPNTSDPSNTAYIGAGEFAVNLTDAKVISSNGTTTFEVGANLSSLNVTGTATLNAVSANGSVGSSGQVLTSNGTTLYWSDRKSTRLNSSHVSESRMPSSA